MKYDRSIFCSILLLSVRFGYAQNFKSELQKLNSQIEIAHKTKKLTDLEYAKMKREQDIIQLTIDKANADKFMDPGEKNKINSKIIRSRKRLAKYKTNREVY